MAGGSLTEMATDALGALVAGVREALQRILEPADADGFVFTAGVIALSAKMAKADGVVLPSEVEAFQNLCRVDEADAPRVAKLYNLARGTVAGYEAYADQLHRHFHDRPDTLTDILDGLFHIAKADGAIHPDETAYLQDVATRFGIGDGFEALLARHVRGENDPHAVLGTDPMMSAEEIRSRYRTLIAEHHPDRMIARGVPESFLKIANDRVAALNTAYDTLGRPS